jgi:hypothetical protein
MISRINNDDMIRTGKINHTTNESVVKPFCIVDYYSNMGAVDNTVIQISFLNAFERLSSAINSYFCMFCTSLFSMLKLCTSKTTGKRLKCLDYRLEVLREMVQKFESLKKERRERSLFISQSLRLIERHFPFGIPENGKKTIRIRQCIVCSRTVLGPKQRIDTFYEFF